MDKKLELIEYFLRIKLYGTGAVNLINEDFFLNWWKANIMHWIKACKVLLIWTERALFAFGFREGIVMSYFDMD